VSIELEISMRTPSRKMTAAPVEMSLELQAPGERYLHDEGGNYEIELEQDVAICRIGTRPDADREESARFALQNVEAFKRLADEPVSAIRAVVLDMTGAPATWGSVTQSCLERMAAIFESAERIMAIVSDDALQSEQLERILRTHAATQGRLFSVYDDALAWALIQG
jgi:hypothetical protein